jgi:cold shock CspA family protein
MEIKEKEFGIIYFIDEPRGFAFVKQRVLHGEDRKYFLHFSKITEGRELLTKGSRVLFDVQPNPKGPVAVNAVIKSAPPKFVRDMAVKRLLEAVVVEAPESEAAQ